MTQQKADRSASIAAVVSLLALGISGLTTYLNFFYEKLEITGAVAAINVGPLAGLPQDRIEIDHHVDVTFVISNTGTLPMTLTDIRLVAETVSGRARADHEPVEPYAGAFEPRLLEPGGSYVFDITYQEREFYEVDWNPATFAADFPPRHERLFLEVTLFDSKGRAHRPRLLACEAHTTFDALLANEWTPELAIACEPTRVTNTLIEPALRRRDLPRNARPSMT